MTELIKQLQEKKGFSESESMIADYLLANFRFLPSMSTRQLARETYTSSAAIVRFCQKLGFGGYTEFRVRFLAEMMQYIERPHGDNLEMTDRDSVHSILDKVTNIEIEALRDTYSMLDPADFMRAYRIISDAGHVDFYATDDNVNIANMAATNLLIAGLSATVYPSVNMLYQLSVSAPRQHVGFFISRTGENRMLIDMAHVLHLRGNPIMLLTAASKSSLGAIADTVFTVATSNKMEELGPRVFLSGAKYVVDILFAVLMTRVDYKMARQKEQWLRKNFHY